MGTARLTGAPSLPRFVWFLSLLLLAPLYRRAERLPVKTYTTADGLLRDVAYCIVQDSRGFLWFCTSDGLSRFDGYSFTNYTTDDGLPHRIVNAFLESRSGNYWVATNNGLARLNPKGGRGATSPIGGKQSSIGNEPEPMFVNYNPENDERSNIIEVLFEDPRGKLWLGTAAGLYWVEEADGRVIFHHVELPKVKPNSDPTVLAMIADKGGNVWVGTDGQGLYRILPRGRIEHYTDKNGLPLLHVSSLLADRNGRIWVGMAGNGGACLSTRF